MKSYEFVVAGTGGGGLQWTTEGEVESPDPFSAVRAVMLDAFATLAAGRKFPDCKGPYVLHTLLLKLKSGGEHARH